MEPLEHTVLPRLERLLGKTPVTGATCVFPVYATTAANPHESSYACYYDEKRDTYLGDWYSVNWMEDSDEASKSLNCD